MCKRDINSILAIHTYFIQCKFENPLCNKSELARKYLTRQISKALKARQSKEKSRPLGLLAFLLPEILLK